MASLDLEGMRTAAAAGAGSRFDRWLAVVGGTPEARSWREFFDDLVDAAGGVGGLDPVDVARAKDAYYAQPRLWAISGTEFDSGGLSCVIEAFQRTREAFVEHARLAAVPRYAMLTADHSWLELSNPGRIGFHPPDRDADLSYLEEANLEMDTLPDAGWLVAVVLHF